MAEKKSWRDYSKQNAAGNSTSSEKTGTWRDYTSDNTTDSGKASASWRDYSTVNSSSIVGDNVVNRVNSWLTNHNTYISDYQNRYSGRKYNYEDAYVSDSASWLDTASKRKSEYDTEADNILSYMDQYKDYLDADWMNEVKKTIANARKQQGTILESYTKDNEYWSLFTPNEEQTAAGYTSDKLYKEWQEEQKQYAEDQAYDVEAGMLELEELKKERDAFLAEQEEKRKQAQKDESFWDSLGRWLGTTPDTTIPLAGVSNSSGNTNPASEYDKQITELEERIERAKYVQGYEGYMTNIAAEDYGANSKYVSTRTDVAKDDARWGLYNNMYDENKLFGDFEYDYINRNQDALDVASVNDTALDAYFLGIDKGFLQTMSDDEIGVYNYLYKTQGKEAANAFLSYIGNDLEGRRRAQEQAFWAAYAKSDPVGSSVFSTLVSPLKGFSYLGQAADMLDDGKMDENAGYNRFSYIPSSIRSQVSTMIESSGKWGKVGSFAYNTGMSMADFLFTTAVSGGNQGLSLAIMGTGAAADATIAAKDRGLEDGEAFALGTIAGLAEVAMEKISLGAWLEGDMTEGALRYVLKNALSEGGEEAGTSVINLLADVMIAGDKSEWNVAMQAYIDQGKTPEEAFGLVAAEQAAQIGLDALGGILSGAGIGGGTYAGTSVAAGFKYGSTAKNKESAQKLVAEGLELNPDSQYIQKAQSKLEKGKNLTGMQVRNILAANQEQITAKDMKKIQKAAEERLTALGQTEDVGKLAEIATKWATGQNLTSAEKKLLTHSQYGSRVANELLPKNIQSGGYTSEWAENIGTRQVNKEAYNKELFDKWRAAVDEIAKMNDPATYKALDERVDEKDKLRVSKTGKATIRESGEEIDLSKAEVTNFITDKKTGKITDMTLNVDGKEVKASGIDYADGDQSYLFSAVQKIENMTPGAATAFIRDYDPASGVSVGAYLNGIDEAFTYGYHNYSEADMQAGNFTVDLSSEQAKGAYLLGQTAKNASKTAKTDAIKRMRTAVEAEAEKAKAEGKEAPKAKKMTITYNEGNGKIVDFDKAGLKLTASQKAAPALAKVFHEMGLGTNFELFASYVNKRGDRVYLDENGVERKAPSGVYRMKDGTVRIDLNAYNGRGLTLDVMAHELTHFIQQWSDTKYQALAEFLVQTYEKTDMTMHERVLREQARLKGVRGEDVSYNEAFDEVVANAMSKMLADGKVMERLNELKAQDADLAQKLWTGLKKLLNKFFRIAEKQSALFHDAADLMELKAEFEQMKQMWAEAFVEASENFQTSLTAAESQTLTEAGIGFDEDTKSVYSLHFSNAYTEQIQVGKKAFDAEAIAQLVSKATGRSIKDARKWVQSEMAIANIVMQNPEFLDFEADHRYEAIKKNSDYPQGTVDLSNLCPKREEFTAMFDMLQKKYPNKLFTAQDVADMRKILSDNDITVACGACFVEDRRQLIGEIADTFIGMWKEAAESGKPLQKTNAAGNKIELLVTKALAKQYGLTAGTKIMATDTYIPNQYDLTTYEGFKLLEKNHPTIAMAFNRYNNSRGQQSARLIEGRAEYNRQILGWSDAKVKSVNNNGGLRIFSFSDFEVVHLLDLVQVIIDCAAKGVKIQGYTKIPAFAKLVRNTGVKLNRSHIPKGDYGYHMENGKVVLDQDTTEGINTNDENFMDESDNPDVGDVIIGINPVQIGAAMLDPFFDYIIPFHSNKAKAILEKLGTGKWVNYKESQHEKDIATGTASKRNVNIYTEVINKYHPTNKVEFVEAFLKECKRQGKIPRYAEFLNVDANGDYAYREGYHKLLVDFKMFDKAGNILPQGNITPNLDESFMKDLLNAEIDKKQNYEFPQEVYDAIDKKFGEQQTSQETDLDTDADSAYDSIGFNDIKDVIKKGAGIKWNNGNAIKLDIAEYAAVVSRISTQYDSMEHHGGVQYIERSTDGKDAKFFLYLFLDHGFDDYDIIARLDYAKKDALIDELRRMIQNGRETERVSTGSGRLRAFYGNAARSGNSNPNGGIKNANGKKNSGSRGQRSQNNGQPGATDSDGSHERGNSTSGVKEQLSSQETDRDTDGKQLSVDQQEFFEESKVRDEQGRLKVLYHGSRYEAFTEFDISQGVWLTPDQRYAEVYAEMWHSWRDDIDGAKRDDINGLEPSVYADPDYRLYKMYANIKNPADIGELNQDITNTVIRNLAKAIGVEYSTVKAMAADYEGQWVYEMTRSEEFIELAYQQGFDGFKAMEKGKETWCAFSAPNQVKLTTNEVPSSFNDIRYSSQETDADLAPTFYSKMGKVIEGIKQDKFGASSVISTLTGRGVKAEEIRWSGIHAFLDGKKSVTKAELLDFIKGSMLQIEEQERGAYKKYSHEQQKRLNELEHEIDVAWDEIWELWEKEFGEGLPMELVASTFVERRVNKIIKNANEEAGTEISENSKRILELARQVDVNRGELETISDQVPETKWGQYKLDGGSNYRELLFKLPDSTYSNTAMKGHWGEDAQGILAHARMQDFEVDGKKMLFIEEIQSDWHNAGSKQGYSTPETQKLIDEFNEVREKRFPYHEKVSPVIQEVCNKLGTDYAGIYHDLLSKDWNTLYYFDEFAKYLSEDDLANLKEDADLYKQHMAIRDKMNAIGAKPGAAPDAPFKDGKYTDFVLKRLLRMAAEEGYDSIGWTTAEIQDERWANTMPHKEGTGKSGFLRAYAIEYDQDIPKFLKKYGKQWGAEVGKTLIDEGNRYTFDEDLFADDELSDEWLLDDTEQPFDGGEFAFKDALTYSGTEVWKMQITDAMKKSVLTEGQELYSSQETDLDSKGNQLTKAQIEFFKDSVVRDDAGKLLVMYHGSQNLGFTVFDPNASDDNRSFFFSDNPGVAASYSDSENEVSPYAVTGKESGLYKTYLNLKNPYVVDARGSKWNNIVEFSAGDEFLSDIGAYMGIVRSMDSSLGISDFLDSLRGDLVGATEYAINDLNIDEDTGESYFTEQEQKDLLELADRIDKAYTEWDENAHLDEDGESTSFESYVMQNYTAKTTRKIASEAYKNGYDGVIFKNLVDVGKFGNIQQQNYEKSTVAVAFDSSQIKSVDNKNPTSDPDMRYSTQETDNIDNRSLLANAFEGITQNSKEYELIQEYKGRIKILNEYEEKLAKLNAEIRKILFDPDTERDAKKLKELQDEAKKVAENINRNDKKLLSLEASGPLRKVIERERKKEARKTKDHVKTLIKNKKDRAEQTELRHKIRKTVRDLDKILNRGNKKQNVKEDMKGFVSKALELADYLFTDHITNDELIRRGITVRMTPEEAALVKETEDILTKLYDEADSLTDEEFTNLDAKRKANEEKLRDLLKAQRNEGLNTPVYNLFNDLVTEYASLKNSSQESVRAAYDEVLENSLRAFMGDEDRVKILKNMRVADMTTEELNWLYRAYTMVLTNVRNANKFHAKGITETIEQVVGQIAGDFGSRKIPDKKLAIAAQKLANKIGWDYEKLYYALDRIGSEAFTKLIMNIANSENIVMQDIIEAMAFRDQIVKNYGFNNWAVNKEIDREFMDNTGKKFKMTLGQMMSLYAYSRREGAWDHIEYGGFVFGEAALTNPRPADSYKLSKEQCEAITNLLTKEQKGYVEDMQKFLSETMGEKGNEVSMQLYGIKMFGEKNYFPIHIAGQFKAQAQESQAKAAAGFGSMSNAGFTHAQNPNAKAPFVLEGFNEVWADHVNEMSRYHGTVPALEDLRRVMNRSTYSDSVSESQSIKQLMENHYGKEAVEYFDNLYREANSGAITDKLQKKSKKLLSLFRKNSVAYSLSVLIQQPASLVRAYAMIDKKYFGFKGFGTITSGVAKAVSSKWNPAYANAYNEMMKYAPGVTMAKEIGGFDTATGGSIRSTLLDTGKSIKQKWNTGTALEKGKAVLDVVDDNAIANLPNVADKIAWIEIWNACKRETVAKRKDLAANSEEFMQAVGERFTEVIRATQVYDSIFAKSPMLKSKNLAVQYLVSFMNEPNTVANMAESAVRSATRGDWKQGMRTGAAVIYSIIFTNVLKSIIYAMRDDDEDETYIEKYIEAITGGLMDDFFALNYIPLARDVVSLAKGYDVERADMAIVSDAIGAVNNVIKAATTDKDDMTEDQLIELDKKQTEANWQLVEALAAFLGIPVKNIRREIEGVIDHARIASVNAGQTTALSLWDKVGDAVIDSIPFMSGSKSKQDKLYNAIISGDKEYLGRIKATYKTDSAYNSAVRKALRENDSRIRAAAQARYDGKTEEYKRIFREIQKEGKFTFDEIMDAVNAEENAIKNKIEPGKVTSTYSASDFVQAVSMGDTGTASAAMDDIIATHVANGKTQSEAEAAFATAVATSTHEAYSAGLLDEAGAENMLVEYAGKDEEEATSKVSYWAFCEDNPQYEYFTESNVKDYREFAEPANISLEVYAQFLNGTKGLADIKDKWGDVEVTKREQVLEVIDSLPLTWEQKDALYLAAGYSESKIWDVPW